MRIGSILWVATWVGFAQAAPGVRHDAIVMEGRTAGSQTVEVQPDGGVRADYSYTDRDHGDHIVATWSLDANGLPRAYEGRGNNYMKVPVDEHFSLGGGQATWKDRSTRGQRAVDGAAFYMPANAPLEFYGVLARALLKAPGHRLALLPDGTASIEPAGSLSVGDGTQQTEWHQYRISGLQFMPLAVWLDGADETAAVILSPWLGAVRKGNEAAFSGLVAEQEKTDVAWYARTAGELTHAPKGDLLIRHARLFDPRDLSVTPDTSVLVRGERVIRVMPDADMRTAADVETIDARGRFLMPGLWDNHKHFDAFDGMLDIANGITSTRDMGNNTDAFLRRVARFDAGTEIGPRVLKAGIIDGIGPRALPFKQADTAEQALEHVDWYADHGYVQIKMYMSIKPELVPIIADRAHARGLRVSGHVPAFMSARQFIEAGADEIQHFNYIELNFLYPKVEETTKMSERFIKVAEHAREFTPDTPQVREFIAFLKHHHTVLDPTMGLLEERLAGRSDRFIAGLEDVAPRFPPQVRREQMGSGYEAPKGNEAAYREAIPSMLKLLKAMHDAGITIVPGTDALAGYMLHHELELYAQAGIAPAEILRMATLTSAQVMGVDRDRSVIAPGKLADMVLIDGDPTRTISDSRNVTTVIKGGKVYDPAAIESALGIAPRQPRDTVTHGQD